MQSQKNQVLKGKQSRVDDGFKCPLCHNEETEFIQSECQHIFCIKCFKKFQKEQKKQKQKQCPMCMWEFEKEQVLIPTKSKSYHELYQEIKVIGAGAFGQAVLIRVKDSDSMTNEFYIAKHILMDKVNEKERMAVKLEADILKELKSDFVVKYVNSYSINAKKLIIVMEYCRYGDLDYQVKQTKKLNKKYTEDQIMFWFAQLMLALKDIHSARIMHRDIKSANVFIGDGNKPHVGDFGVSKISDPNEEKKGSTIGTIFYMAPEVIDAKPYQFQSDVWSMGVVLYELLTLKKPFTANNMSDGKEYHISMEILKKEPEPIDNSYSAEIRELLNLCLLKDHTQRPNAFKLLKENEFLKKSIERIQNGEIKPFDPEAQESLDPETALAQFLSKGKNLQHKDTRTEQATKVYTQMKKEVNYESDSDDFGRGTETADLGRNDQEDSDDFGRDESTVKKEIQVQNEDSDDDFGRATVTQKDTNITTAIGSGLADQSIKKKGLEAALEEEDSDDCKTYNFSNQQEKFLKNTQPEMKRNFSIVTRLENKLILLEQKEVISSLIGQFLKNKFIRRVSINQTFTRTKTVRPQQQQKDNQISLAQAQAAMFLGVQQNKIKITKEEDFGLDDSEDQDYDSEKDYWKEDCEDSEEDLEYYLEEPEEENESEESDEEEDEESESEYSDEEDDIAHTNSGFVSKVLGSYAGMLANRKEANRQLEEKLNEQQFTKEQQEKAKEYKEPVILYKVSEEAPYATVPLEILVGNVHINQHKGMAAITENHNTTVCCAKDHRWIMFTYLDDNKKQLSDKVIKQVKYTINDNNINNQKELKMAITKMQPFLLSRLGNKRVQIKIEITFRKWTRLLPATYNHTLSLDGNGSGNNKNYSIRVPRETYIENMMDKSKLSAYQTTVDSKYQKLEIEVGIQVKFAKTAARATVDKLMVNDFLSKRGGVSPSRGSVTLAKGSVSPSKGRKSLNITPSKTNFSETKQKEINQSNMKTNQNQVPMSPEKPQGGRSLGSQKMKIIGFVRFADPSLGDPKTGCSINKIVKKATFKIKGKTSEYGRNELLVDKMNPNLNQFRSQELIGFEPFGTRIIIHFDKKTNLTPSSFNIPKFENREGEFKQKQKVNIEKKKLAAIMSEQ